MSEKFTKREKSLVEKSHDCFSSISDPKLVPEQADEAEEDSAGRPRPCLPGKCGLSVYALSWAADIQARAVPQISGGPGCCLVCESTQPAVQLSSARRLNAASGLILPVQQPAGGDAALCHNPTHGLLSNLPSVLLVLLWTSCSRMSNWH